MVEYIPILTHATERDIDLLIVEELSCSVSFVLWLASHVGWKGEISKFEVLHSKRRIQNRREIDIELTIHTKNGRGPIRILIENKLDTDPQPNQSESYKQECKILSEQENFSLVSCMLVCPKSYQANHSSFAEGFDVVVTYEEIQVELINRAKTLHTNFSELINRLQYRARLLDQAINKHRRGYEPVPLTEIGDFNEKYIKLLQMFAPKIIPGPSMLKKSNPSESVSMIFDNKTFEDLPQSIRPTRFAHEFGKGQTHRANYVAILFKGWGYNFNNVKNEMLHDIKDTTFKLTTVKPNNKRPNPALRLYIETPAINNLASFDDQVPKLEEGIKSAEILRLWVYENIYLLEKWCEKLGFNSP